MTSRTDKLADALAATAPTSPAPAGAGRALATRKPDPARDLLDSMADQFAAALPKMLPVETFTRVALTGFRKVPKLLDCNRQSLFAALLDCARLGLTPCTEQASLVPFGKEVTLIVGYEGFVQLMYRSGEVEQVVAELVYDADEWEYSLGDGGRFFHRPNILADDRGPVLFAYCYAALRGGGRTRVAIVTRKEAERLQRDYGRGDKRSAWYTNFEAMWLKTAVRRAQKFAPKSSELRRALDVDGVTYAAGEVVPPADVVDGEVVPPTSAPPATDTPASDDPEPHPLVDDDPWAGIDVAQPGGGAV